MIDLPCELVTVSGWKGKVLRIYNAHKVEVEWQDGSITFESASHIRKGSIKPPFQPSVFNEGYIGLGKYVDYRNKGNHAPKHWYAYWQRMLARCYSPLELSKQKGKSYVDVVVRDDWKNFNNFADWIALHRNANKGWDLDKDLLGDGTIYSPESSAFLPKEINIALAEHMEGTLPKGVNYIPPKTSGSKEGYIARCSINGERKYLGYFENVEDALSIYIKTKEEYFKFLANKYKNELSTLEFEKLYTRKVN